MAENAEQISETLVLDYIKKKDPSLGQKISKKWNAPELPPGSPDVKEVVAHFLKTSNKKRRESLELLTPAKKSKSEKPSTPKTNGVANGTAKLGKTNGHAKGSDSSSEESSDEEEKPVVAKKTPSKSPKVVRPTAPVQEDSSEESSSDEEEKPAAKKVVPPKTTPKQAPKKETSSEESSDDDEPPKKPQVKAPKVVANVVAKKESSSSEEDSSEEEPPKKQAKSPKVTKPVTKKESSSDDSSDDEPPKPKVAPKQTAKVQVKPVAKESSDDSDSSEESEAETKKKASAKKVAPAKAASSSDEESSDEEEAKKPVVKKAPAKPAAKKESSDEDSSDEEEPPKKVAKKQAKKESSSSGEESDSDDEEEAKPAAPIVGEKRKRDSEGGAEFGNRQKFIKADAAFNGDSAEVESCDLFVNRIGSSMTDDQLYEHFKQFGSVERAKIATDRETGDSRGFAFVTFSSPAEVKAALSHGFSHMIDGTECSVRLSEPKPMAGGQQKFGGNNSFGNNSFGASDSGESRELFVNRLDYSFTDDHLYEYFKQFGSVERARVATDRETGDSRGFAFITFATPEDAKAAVAKGPTHSIEGSEFCIRLAEPKGASDGGRQQFAAPQTTQRRKSEPFRRVREEEVVVDPKFTNAFTAKRGAEDDWGFRAHRDLIKTRGKGFRHEKNKKKKGSYSGGTISTAVTSIKFD